MDDIAQQLSARLRQDPSDLAAFNQLRGHYQAAGDHHEVLEGDADRSKAPR